ncbi:hypothetical protein D6D01_06955 [Aureobasidium pullulans]|uniref:Uncharacterized protein n=1 Tax=Aureobasidium pullulans TaxID=5580 RepID=A0A4S9KU25_AURPU|nr:hypothetical protein D6D01_06955 [Aureobasidium pullulans]
MTLVGLFSFQTPLSEDNLSWIIRDSDLQSTITTYNRTVTRSFYLATPPLLSLTSSILTHRGCAIFVVSPDRGAYQFYSKGAPQYANEASCAGALGENCIDDLTGRVDELARSNAGADTYSFCANIGEGLQTNPPLSCHIRGQRIDTVALTGSSAPQPIMEQGNGSSNCWPTLPKTNDLTKTFEYDHVAYLDDTVPWLGYNPLITVFQASENQTGASSDDSADVQLACMKIVDSDNCSGRTLNNGTETGDAEGGASILQGSVWSVMVLVAGAMFLLV